MKIQLKAQYAGPRGVFAPGAVIDVPEAEANALIGGGYAVAVQEAAPAPVAVLVPVAVETAEAPAAETAEAPRPQRKSRK